MLLCFSFFLYFFECPVSCAYCYIIIIHSHVCRYGEEFLSLCGASLRDTTPLPQTMELCLPCRGGEALPSPTYGLSGVSSSSFLLFAGNKKQPPHFISIIHRHKNPNKKNPLTQENETLIKKNPNKILSFVNIC